MNIIKTINCSLLDPCKTKILYEKEVFSWKSSSLVAGTFSPDTGLWRCWTDGWQYWRWTKRIMTKILPGDLHLCIQVLKGKWKSFFSRFNFLLFKLSFWNSIPTNPLHSSVSRSLLTRHLISVGLRLLIDCSNAERRTLTGFPFNTVQYS